MKKNYLLLMMFVVVLLCTVNVYAEDCSGVFGPEFISAIDDYIYTPIKWLTPVALLLLTSIDFIDIVFNGNKDKMGKAKDKFLKRLVAAVIIFFAPKIIILIVELVDEQSISSCLNSF